MLTKLQSTILVVATVLVTLVAAGLVSAPVSASIEDPFNATLTGAEEVPPVETQASGAAQFQMLDENAMSYSVNATGIQSVTAGHIHAGLPGENGEVLVTLLSYDPPMDDVAETGTITADDLEGPMVGSPLSDLMDAMENGETYVNIHTEQYPNGEIRGQIRDVTAIGSLGLSFGESIN
jgi:hypothetical protein